MKEDKEKEAKLEAVKKELNEKIQGIMGPTPEDSPPTAAPEPEPKPAAKPKPKPKPEEPKTEEAPMKGVPPVPAADSAKAADKPEPAEPKTDADKPAEEPKQDTATDSEEDLDTAVDDIAASESDEVLAAEDEAVERAFDSNNKKQGFWEKTKDFLRRWWENPKARWATIIGVSILIILLASIPNTRYFFLNIVGVRSRASLKVLDQSTQQPLKNVTVSIGNQTGVTDNEGQVYLSKLKLGKQDMAIDRRAFAEVDKKVTIGWGSNPLGDYQLEPTGIQYTFQVNDFLSDKPIAKAEAISGDASAFSDDTGKLVLTLDTKSDEDVEITISKDGYRNEQLMVGDPNQAIEVKMVPAKKHVFVSKRSGKYDVYKIDADGKNEELVLAGTGTERDDMVLVPHPTKNVAALVSTRDNMRNSDGYLLSTLTILNLETNESVSLGRSERFEVVGWVGDKLVYVQIAAGASTNNPKRQRLMTYDYATGESTEIAATNYFNDIVLANDKIYYAPSAAFSDGANIALFVVDADGKNRKPLIDKEVWNIFRTEYNKLAIAVGQAWYEYNLGDGSLNAMGGAPATQKSRIYVNSPDKENSIWPDERDGKGVLLVYNLTDKDDATITAQSGLTTPITWLNDTTVVYRINTDQETADYVVNIQGGEPRKLVDVTNTGGIDRWYYY